MRIEVWSDFTCPFCFIGRKTLEMALQQFKHREYVQIEYKCYQLDSNAGKEKTEDIYSMLMKKYGLSIEKVKEMMDQICIQAEQIGLHFQFEKLQHANTFHAHRLVKFAEREEKEQLIIDLLFKKHFIEHENIGERDVLLSIAKEAELNESDVDSLLCLNNYAKAVKNDEQMAEEIGISGVPFYIFNDQHAVAGAQPLEVFVTILEELWNEEIVQEKGNNTNNQCKSSYCTGNDCE
ncbi:DsbA family oxidoreductase [Pseudogracilibacillus sp. SE30717A]|uniref:DsbA family oxidoreductase n=1 Tax=Pseudogracilibacillus sp. SE30717A TaxID=3098293 RepID=UPI00300DCCD4